MCFYVPGKDLGAGLSGLWKSKPIPFRRDFSGNSQFLISTEPIDVITDPAPP